MKTSILLALSGCLVLGGCVSKGKYDQAIATTETTRAQLQQKNSLLQQKDALLDQTNAELAQRRSDVAKLKSEIEQLEQLGRSRSGEHAATRSRLGELQRRLSELEAAQRASEARAALYKDLSHKLRKQIDDGDLAIVLRDGRMVLQLPNDVLFDTGRTEIKPTGKAALEAIAEVMKQMPQRQFQVAGHTDNVPIHNDRFASNWELSAGRALRVVHFLIGAGANAATLSAAGYSEVDPVAENTSPEGRKQNRRTEITLQPNIDELVKLPE